MHAVQFTSHLLHDFIVDEGKYPVGHELRHEVDEYCSNYPPSGHVEQYS